jgi:hypothetical protein
MGRVVTLGNWKLGAILELGQADAARAVGNEGRARVCARRAAGIIAQEFMRRQGIDLVTPSAFDLLRDLQSSPLISQEIQEKTTHFLLRVDTDFSLPAEVDLLADARWLAIELLGETL